MVKVPASVAPQLSSCALPQRASGGPVQLGTARVGPGQRAPIRRLSCSSQPPPKSPILLRLSFQAVAQPLPMRLAPPYLCKVVWPHPRQVRARRRHWGWLWR